MGAGHIDEGWLIGFAGSTITAITFLAVAVGLFISLRASGQWRSNPLGVGTLFLFITCGGGHLIHSIQMAYIWMGLELPYGEAIRVEYGDWHMWVADGATAVAGVVYWTMRTKFPDLVQGTAVYEDLREKQRQALAIHDNVVQGLAKARLALELDEHDITDAALAQATKASDDIITELIGQERRHGA